MPPDRRTPSQEGVSRRAALTAGTAGLLGLAGVLSGCSPYELQTQRRRPPRPTASPVTQAEPDADPDVALAGSVLAAEQAMLNRVDATLARHPRLGRALRDTRRVHEAHVALLDEAAPHDVASGTDPTPSAATTPDPSDPSEPDGSGASGGRPRDRRQAGSDAQERRRGPEVPADPASALRALARAEDALSLSDKQAAFAAQSGGFARVLASMAAAAAQQSATLRTTAVGQGPR